MQINENNIMEVAQFISEMTATPIEKVMKRLHTVNTRSHSSMDRRAQVMANNNRGWNGMEESPICGPHAYVGCGSMPCHFSSCGVMPNYNLSGCGIEVPHIGGCGSTTRYEVTCGGIRPVRSTMPSCGGGGCGYHPTYHYYGC